MLQYSTYHNDIRIINIDGMFRITNRDLGQFLLNSGLPISFDFSDKNNRTLYTHFFLKTMCDSLLFLKEPNNKIIYYNNTLTKDPFRNKLIAKIRKVFGIKIFDGVWDIGEFLEMARNKNAIVIDKLELLVQCDCKPKSFREIKKYLLKEGLTNLNDSYFQEIANKALILC